MSFFFCGDVNPCLLAQCPHQVPLYRTNAWELYGGLPRPRWQSSHCRWDPPCSLLASLLTPWCAHVGDNAGGAAPCLLVVCEFGWNLSSLTAGYNDRCSHRRSRGHGESPNGMMRFLSVFFSIFVWCSILACSVHCFAVVSNVTNNLNVCSHMWRFRHCLST